MDSRWTSVSHIDGQQIDKCFTLCGWTVSCHVVDRYCFTVCGQTVFLIKWMNKVSYHVDGQCFLSCGWTMFHVMWAGSVPCHVTGLCFMSCEQTLFHIIWTVFHVMWMDSVLCHVDGHWPHLDEQNVSHHSDINRNVHHLDEWSFSSFERTVFHSILDEQCFTLSLLAVFVIYIIWLHDRYFTVRCSWCHASEQCFTSAEHCFISEWLPCHITWHVMPVNSASHRQNNASSLSDCHATSPDMSCQWTVFHMLAEQCFISEWLPCHTTWERAWKVFHNLQMSSIWRNLVNTVSVTQSISHWWTLSV